MVVSTLMLALSGAVFLHRAFAQKMKVNRDARLEAWSRALGGCRSDFDTEELWKTTGEPLEDVNTDSPPGFLSVGHTSSSVTGSPVAAPQLVGGSAVSLSASHRIACNDQLKDERESVWGRIGDALGTIVKF